MNDDEQRDCRILPTIDRFTYRPMSSRSEPWWFRCAWAGWYWLEFETIMWDQSVFPKEPRVSFTVHLRLRGRAWSVRSRRLR